MYYRPPTFRDTLLSSIFKWRRGLNCAVINSRSFHRFSPSLSSSTNRFETPTRKKKKGKEKTTTIDWKANLRAIGQFKKFSQILRTSTQRYPSFGINLGAFDRKTNYRSDPLFFVLPVPFDKQIIRINISGKFRQRETWNTVRFSAFRSIGGEKLRNVENCDYRPCSCECKTARCSTIGRDSRKLCLYLAHRRRASRSSRLHRCVKTRCLDLLRFLFNI